MQTESYEKRTENDGIDALKVGQPRSPLEEEIRTRRSKKKCDGEPKYIPAYGSHPHRIFSTPTQKVSLLRRALAQKSTVRISGRGTHV